MLDEHGYAVRIAEVTEEDVDALDPTDADLVVVLSGEMGAYQTDEFPFLEAEQRLLRSEVTDAMHEQWVGEGYNELDEHAIDPDALRRERERHSARMQDASRAAFSEWLEHLPR